MSCSATQDQLSCYIDGALDQRAADILDAHVRDCRCCERERSALQRLVSTAQQITDIAPPANLRSRILAATSQAAETDSRERLHPLFTPARAGWAAGAMAAGVVAVTLIANSPQAPITLDQRVHGAEAATAPSAEAAQTPAAVSAASEIHRTAASHSRTRLSRHESQRGVTPTPAALTTIAAKPASIAKPLTDAAGIDSTESYIEPAVPAAESVAEVATAVPAQATESKAEPAVEATTAGTRVAAMQVVVEGNKDWSEELKDQAAMRKGSANSGAVWVISSRF